MAKFVMQENTRQFYPDSQRRISSEPENSLELRIQELTLELNSLKNLESELQSRDIHEARMKSDWEALESEKRKISDLYRKTGILEINDSLAPETQAAIQNRSWANVTNLAAIVAHVDLHAAHMRFFSELARKIGSSIDIDKTRKEKSSRVAETAKEERENPQISKPVDREEVKRRADVAKAAEGDKALAKALTMLTKSGFSVEVAKQMLQSMKAKKA